MSESNQEATARLQVEARALRGPTDPAPGKGMDLGARSSQKPSHIADVDYEWPEVKDLRPAEAMRLLDDVESAARQANKLADLLKTRKAQAKQIALAVLEDYELDSARTTTASGQKVQFTPYDFDIFSVDDEAAFRAWADEEAERYYDDSPRLRDGIFLDEMRRRQQDGEPMPPGVKRWTDIRLSRTAVTKSK